MTDDRRFRTARVSRFMYEGTFYELQRYVLGRSLTTDELSSTVHQVRMELIRQYHELALFAAPNAGTRSESRERTAALCRLGTWITVRPLRRTPHTPMEPDTRQAS